ncbi:hypothetical protein CKF94_18595 [Vibrio coralliilyticus]|uniref:Cache domain-containing protein n=1 Tax=Vibrio coralliilyticus TaxID=190893 RepID=A0AAN0SIP3_9VIBR|nr:hypothetical protein [Vibrio coralliilyticus]AIW22031.1 hypothetical protein IX92_23980 [Vibrio coralliilyticus]AXN33724.1 hypothetical protein DVV14_21020 [Vibrio coralliilyticus]KPH24733.1 hypothetical protein ADU60_25480 [Vibrio coralliilyticus]NOH37567.1 hypothetical protein [Vibrio coralliilyticus]PAU36699.1 hypothetical protein CKF94_18595 [Vibrio coralliilyticus]
MIKPSELQYYHLRWIAALIWSVAAFITITLYQLHADIDTDIRHHLVEQSQAATQAINKRLAELSQKTELLAAAINQKQRDDKELRHLITQSVMTTQGAHRGGVAFRKNRYSDPANPLYSPYFQKNGDNRQSQQISERYDYTLPDRMNNGPRTFWFHQPMSKGSMWMEPYFGTNANTWLAEFIVPFESNYDGQMNNGFDGIVFLNFSLNSLTKQVLNLDLGSQGFGMLISRTGQILAYPNKSVLGKDIYSLDPTEYPLLASISEQLTKGDLSTFSHPVTGREEWMVLSNIEGLDAQLGLIIDADELRTSTTSHAGYHDLIWFLSIAGLIIFVASLRFPDASRAKLRRLFTVLSLCLLSYLLLLWYQALAPKPLSKGEALLVNEESAYLAWQAQYPPGKKASSEHIHQINLTVESLDLVEADQVSIVGKIITSDQATDEPPLHINNSLDTSWSLIRESEGFQLWQFVALIKQPFDYESFPFDREVIELTMIPRPDSGYLMLVPEFDSYPSMRPEDLPGIRMAEHDFGSWKLLQSYFSYQTDKLYNGHQTVNLKYNMVIQRSITGPLISHIMPLLVVSFLTYCMLLLWTKDEKQQALWGFNTATVLQYCASLFFILVIAHVALREELNAQGVIFIEYFYFLAYLQIIFTSIGALAYTTEMKIHALEYQQGLRVKQWYWPLLLMLSLIITLLFIEK